MCIAKGQCRANFQRNLSAFVNYQIYEYKGKICRQILSAVEL